MSKLKSLLKSNKTALGSWITLAHPSIAEIIAKIGFDWIAVDLEHSSIDFSQAENLIRVIDLCGVSPLVRLTSNDRNQIKRVMDAGAHGIIVPMVNSKAEAEAAVDSVYYPPRGKRGVGLSRAQGYGASFEEYKKWVENSPLVIVQIEHIDAVENLEAILCVEGVDGYMVGPYDLSASLGIPGEFSHPKMLAALEKLKATGARSKKIPGYHVVQPDVEQLLAKEKEGFKFLAFSTDMLVLEKTFRNAYSSILKR